jgi:hypothetical protein
MLSSTMTIMIMMMMTTAITTIMNCREIHKCSQIFLSSLMTALIFTLLLATRFVGLHHCWLSLHWPIIALLP